METTAEKKSETQSARPASASADMELRAKEAFEAARSSPSFRESLAALPEKDREPSKALIACAVAGDKAGIAELASAGYPMDLRDKDGRTALWAAAKLGKDECCSALIAAGASPHAPDRHGVTPSEVAWGKSREAIAAVEAKQDLARACQKLKALSTEGLRGLGRR